MGFGVFELSAYVSMVRICICNCNYCIDIWQAVPDSNVEQNLFSSPFSFLTVTMKLYRLDILNTLF